MKDKLDIIPDISSDSIWDVARNCFVHFDGKYCIVKTQLYWRSFHSGAVLDETYFTIHKEMISGVFIKSLIWSKRIEYNCDTKEEALALLENVKLGITLESLNKFYDDCVER